MRNEDDETGPDRTCVATRSVLPVSRLIRFVLDPAGILTPDLKGKLPGRGAWVTASRDVLKDALRRKCFARSLKKPVEVPDHLAESVEALLAAEVRQALAMANKAGQVIAGFAKVEAALAQHKAIAILSAVDGSADGKRKLSQAIMRYNGNPQAIPFISVLSGDEMDLALGRENAIHAALQAGSASDAFLMKCQRLVFFRLGPSDVKRPDAEETSAFSGHSVLDSAETAQNDDAEVTNAGRLTE